MQERRRSPAFCHFKKALGAGYLVIVDMPIIMGMPPHIIIIGIPDAIIFVIMSQRSLSMSIDMPSGGIILQVIPSLVISQDILHIIGMPMLIMLGIMPIMLGIMLIMLGIMLIMLGIIGMPIMLGIMPMPIMPGIIGMPMPIMPGIIDPPAVISGDVMAFIVCGIMGICIAVVMGAFLSSALVASECGCSRSACASNAFTRAPIALLQSSGGASTRLEAPASRADERPSWRRPPSLDRALELHRLEPRAGETVVVLRPQMRDRRPAGSRGRGLADLVLLRRR